MKYKIKTSSSRGKLAKKIDKVVFEILKAERGYQCEIHPDKPCTQLGTMHILSKGAHPRLRWVFDNLIIAGWFCSHFWTHHSPDDPRAIFANAKIKQLRGEDYKYKFYQIEKIIPRMTEFKMEEIFIQMKNRLDELTAKPKGKKHVKVKGKVEERYVREA